MHMFCYQCQETGDERGCSFLGACGKDDETANLQDLLIHTLKGVALAAEPSLASGHVERDAAGVLARGLFATVTNTNFDAQRFYGMIREAVAVRDRPRGRHAASLPAATTDALTWRGDTPEEMRARSLRIDIRDTVDPDLRSMRELVVYGLKGIGAYLAHAAVLGHHDDAVNDFLVRALAALTRETSEAVLDDLALETGRQMVAAMAVLDEANAATYGDPEAGPVRLGTRDRPGILVTGHDLKDLEELLEQTAGTGVDVYTHCEMWAAHSYPRLRAHEHLVGHYGNAWWLQDDEFEVFGGPVLVTSNCIVPVRESYRRRIFTTGVAGFPGVAHVADAEPGRPKDFSALVALARTCPPPRELERGEIVAGFSHRYVAKHLDAVLGAVKGGAIRRFVVMGGCDGRDGRRDYFTRAARALPKDSVILTAGCAKFRYVKEDLGTAGGLPRVLDAGQCNDCYSLVRIALALKDALRVADVNDLPVDFDLAWYDQKAVGVVLALVALGFRGVRMGPTLPAFLLTAAGRRFLERHDVRQTDLASA